MDREIVLKRACDLSSDILFRISESEGVEVRDPLCTGAFLAGDRVLYRRLGLFLIILPLMVSDRKNYSQRGKS